MNGRFFLLNSSAVRNEDDAAEGQDADDSGFHNLGYWMLLIGSGGLLFFCGRVP